MSRPISTERLRQLATITPNIGLSRESAEELRALASEALMLREATTRVVEPTPDNCTHNRAIEPDTGECLDCGTVLP